MLKWQFAYVQKNVIALNSCWFYQYITYWWLFLWYHVLFNNKEMIKMIKMLLSLGFELTIFCYFFVNRTCEMPASSSYCQGDVSVLTSSRMMPVPSAAAVSAAPSTRRSFSTSSAGSGSTSYSYRTLDRPSYLSE